MNWWFVGLAWVMIGFWPALMQHPCRKSEKIVYACFILFVAVKGLPI